MQQTPQHILNYWFGDGATASEVSDRKRDIWWKKDPTADAEITNLFQDTTERVFKGDLADWCDTPEGLLASIICLDQFTRNMYRDNLRAFSHDDFALAFTKTMLKKNWDQNLPSIQRVFAYMPFEHSEDLHHQATSIKLFSDLLEISQPEERHIFQGFLEFAQRHYEVIQRFGRFPHRNVILARKSSAEELDYLNQPGAGF